MCLCGDFIQLFTAAGTTQVRPQTSTQGVSGGVQNVQIIQGPNGQLQVRGLMPGKYTFQFILISSLEYFARSWWCDCWCKKSKI